jgi:hypothetical protein
MSVACGLTSEWLAGARFEKGRLVERPDGVFRAGFTGTHRVLVRAVPSAGVGGQAPLLGVRGSGEDS